jgi:hypothetical protein
MGPGKYEIVGKSQPVLIITNPIISTRTRSAGGYRSCLATTTESSACRASVTRSRPTSHCGAPGKRSPAFYIRATWLQ